MKHDHRQGEADYARSSVRILLLGTLLFAATADTAVAKVIFETGTVSGHVDSVGLTASGSFFFDGDTAGCGLDYSGDASAASPGGWAVTMSPGRSGTWSGDFTGSGAGSPLFGTTSGEFAFSVTRLILSGPITFNGVPPLSSVGLTNPRFSSRAGVFNVVSDAGGVISYDFSGPFELAADAPSSVVIPGARIFMEGNGYSTSPFSRPPGVTQRVQTVYSGSEFPCPDTARLITGMIFRPDAPSGFPASFEPIVEINLSTTARPPDGLSTVLADNVGMDATTVVSGQLFLNTNDIGPPAGPKNFDVTILFSTPFYYMPAAGNLLVDVSNLGSSGPIVPLDADASFGDAVSRVSTPVAADGHLAPAGSADTIGLVARFLMKFPAPAQPPLILDFDSVLGFDQGGGAVRVRNFYQTAQASVAAIELGGPLLSTILQATGWIGSATLAPFSGGPPLTQKTLPVGGLLKVCYIDPGCGIVGLTAPLTNGTAGLGIGGMVVAGGAAFSIEGAPWTFGVASVMGLPASGGGTTTSRLVGFRHGPASATTTASQPGGVMRLVAPARVVASTLIGTEPFAMFAVMHVVPEPSRFLLLAAGAVGLFVMGRSRWKP